MGVVKMPGLVLQVPLNQARNLLRTDNELVAALGKQHKFEIIVGMNGAIMYADFCCCFLLLKFYIQFAFRITGQPQTVVAVQNAILRQAAD